MMTPSDSTVTSILQAGAPLEQAKGALILLHGRGGSAEGILDLGEVLAPEEWALLVPQAEQNAWYPYSFLAPRAQNEPALSASLEKVRSTLRLAEDAGIPLRKIVLAGFSQGACLATDFVARNVQRYGGLLAFTGGLIGVPGELPLPSRSLAGTPVLLSSGDPDPHVPWARVTESSNILRAMGAEITLNRYPGRPHTVVSQEIEEARVLIRNVERS